ncbi:MAG: sodium-dependent bicarbonate transport family permease, partial [Pseudomonadota bacterium]
MADILNLAAGNLISPIILSFVLGLLAALARSELTIPEAVAKGMSIYLLFA